MIENEINRDLTQRAAASEALTDYEEVGEQLEEQDNAAVSDDFDSGIVDLDEEQNEAEEMGMSMGM